MCSYLCAFLYLMLPIFSASVLQCFVFGWLKGKSQTFISFLTSEIFWKWQICPSPPSCPMLLWRWGMASLCASTSKLDFANLVNAVARDMWKKLAKQRTAKRPVPLDTQNLANILPWTSSASLAKLAAISTVLTLLIAISVSRSEFCRPQLMHCQNLWRLLRKRLWSWKIQTNVTCVITLHLPALD